MNYLTPHLRWIGLLTLAVTLTWASTPLLDRLHEIAAQRLIDARAARAAAEQSLHQLQDDIAAAEKLGGQIGIAEADRALIPADRIAAVTALERSAAALRLGHFTYTLEPEQALTVDAPGIVPQTLAVSTLTVSGEAPLDTDVYAFCAGARRFLPGRLRLQQLSVERTGSAAALEARNTRFTARFEWLSNGSAGAAVASAPPQTLDMAEESR